MSLETWAVDVSTRITDDSVNTDAICFCSELLVGAQGRAIEAE